MTAKQIQIIEKLIRALGLYHRYSILTYPSGSISFVDTTDKTISSCKTGLNHLFSHIVRPLADYGLTGDEECEFNKLVEALAIPYSNNYTIIANWANGISVKETFELNSERIVYLSEMEERCREHRWKAPEIKQIEVK